MKTSEIRKKLVAVRTYVISLTMLKDVFYVGDKPQFDKVLKHIELENSDAKFLQNLQNAYKYQDAEALAYLLLAENKKITDDFFAFMSEIRNFIDVWPKIRNAYLSALYAVYLNQLNKEEFFGKLNDTVSKLRIYEDEAFLGVFYEQISTTLGVEITLSIKGVAPKGDWFVELFRILTNCKYTLVNLGMLEHALYGGDDAQFEAWKNHLQVFYHNDELVEAIAQLRESVFNEDNDDEDDENGNEHSYADEITNLFRTMASDVAKIFFDQCMENTKYLETLDDGDLFELENLVDNVFADMAYDEHLQAFDLYERMAKLLCKWQGFVDPEFVKNICARVPNEKSFLFITTLSKLETGSCKVKIDDKLLQIFYQSQRPEDN